MAENNLVARITSDGVREVLQKTNNLSRSIRYNKTGEGEAYVLIENYIKSLYDEALKQESEFFNCEKTQKGVDDKISFLQEKLNELNKDYGFARFINDDKLYKEAILQEDNKKLNKYSNMNTFAGTMKGATKSQVQSFTLTGEYLDEKIKKISQEEINKSLNESDSLKKLVLDTISESMRRDNNGNLTTRGGTNKSSSLGQYIQAATVGLKPIKKGKKTTYKITVTANPDITDYIKSSQVRKIEDAINMRCRPDLLDVNFITAENSQQVPTAETLKMNLIDWANNNIQNAKIRELTIQEIRKIGMGSYDFKNNVSVVKGILGEIHANVFFRYIFGDSAEVTPTGAMTATDAKGAARRGAEIPIDTVITMLNRPGAPRLHIQTKNYAISNGTVTFPGGEGQAANIIQNRLLPNNDSLANILIEFFGSMQFNQPLDGDDAKYKNLSKYRQMYKEFYDNRTIMGVQRQLNYIAEANIMNLIGMSTQFSAEKLFPNEKLETFYLNNIYYISGRIIPSSRILNGILVELKNSSQRNRGVGNWSLFKANIYGDGTTLGKYEGSNYEVKEFTVNPSSKYRFSEKDYKASSENLFNYSINLKDAANEIKMVWKVNMNIDNVLNAAVDKVLK